MDHVIANIMGVKSVDRPLNFAGILNDQIDI